MKRLQEPIVTVEGVNYLIDKEGASIIAMAFANAPVVLAA